MANTDGYLKDDSAGNIPASYSTVDDNAAKVAAMSPAARAAYDASKASWTEGQDAYTTAIVPGTGLTQAQIDTRESAAGVAASINESYSGLGIASTVDPKTGKITTTNKGVPITNTLPGSPLYGANITTTFGTADTSKVNVSDATRDAFAMLEDLFRSYGLGSLAGEIADYMKKGLTASEALIKLKTNPNGAYAERFAGNFARTKNGLNVMSESAYIELENSYANTLKAYGLGSMISTDAKANWKQFSTWIANDMSALEFKDRIATVEDRVVNADASIKATFKQFYPNLTDQDLVAYFLNPTETIGKLKEKVTSAEIGAAFLGQGLDYTQASANELAKYGIDRAGALQGTAQIAEVLPTSQKLSNIYGEAGINYNQKSGEAEFLKSNQNAADQRKRLKSMERASFSGDSGVSSQYGSLAKNTQGAF
jgi:hypothetical protein